MAVKSFYLCTGLEWKRVKISHSGCYGAVMALYFGIVQHILLTILDRFHSCSAALTQGQGLFCSPSQQADLTNMLGLLGQVTCLWELTPAYQVDVPYHMRTSSVIKSFRKKKEWKTLRVMDIQNNGICLPGGCCRLAFLEMTEDLPACEKWWMNFLVCFVCLQLLLLFWLSSPSLWGKVNEWPA